MTSVFAGVVPGSWYQESHQQVDHVGEQGGEEDQHGEQLQHSNNSFSDSFIISRHSSNCFIISRQSQRCS